MLQKLKSSLQMAVVIGFCTAQLTASVVRAEDAPPESAPDSKEESNAKKKKDKDETKSDAKGEAADAAAPGAPAAGDPPPDRGFNAALGIMAMTNSTDQGGTGGPSGTTILSQFEFGYHYKYVGAGVYGQFDLQGSNQIDFLFGPKIEARYTIFFADVSFAPYMQRGFTDRSIARQVGNAWVFSLGVRVPVKLLFIKSLPKGTGFFLLACYKYRIQNIYFQDATPLTDALIQRDGYPLFGLGFRF